MLLRTGDLIYLKLGSFAQSGEISEGGEVVAQVIERNHRERSWSFFVFGINRRVSFTDEAISGNVRVMEEYSLEYGEPVWEVQEYRSSSSKRSTPLEFQDGDAVAARGEAYFYYSEASDTWKTWDGPPGERGRASARSWHSLLADLGPLRRLP